MLTKNQLEDAARCGDGILCEDCTCNKTLCLPTKIINQLAETALQYRTMLEELERVIRRYRAGDGVSAYWHMHDTLDKAKKMLEVGE